LNMSAVIEDSVVVSIRSRISVDSVVLRGWLMS